MILQKFFKYQNTKYCIKINIKLLSKSIVNIIQIIFTNWFLKEYLYENKQYFEFYRLEKPTE